MTKKTVRTVSELISQKLAPADEHAALAMVAQKYSVAVSPHLMDLIQKEEGVRKQFIPTVDELVNTSKDMADPIGDKTNSPIRGLIHRYPDRCLLQPVTVCPVYCRFCFRRETVGKGNPSLSAQQLQECYAYIQAHPQIWEVILSGGDPLILKPKQIAKIIENINKISHVEIIRIHTRIPTVDPARINDEMICALKQRQPVYIVMHINHPGEFTESAIKAINMLADNGIVLLGQTVLLKGINDNIETLGKLMRTMIKYRIKPYYLHHVDLAAGTSHFRTTIAQGQELVAKLRGNYSGICLPEYVLDIPGGFGKSPIGPNYLCKHEHGYRVKDYTGQEHIYTD